MIRYGKDMVREVRARMRDGKGEVEMTHIFTPDELASKIRLCAQISIPPGGSGSNFCGVCLWAQKMMGGII